jgi:hypothetical protein
MTDAESGSENCWRSCESLAVERGAFLVRCLQNRKTPPVEAGSKRDAYRETKTLYADTTAVEVLCQSRDGLVMFRSTGELNSGRDSIEAQ